MIPDSFINDLQNRLDIVELVGQYVQLKKNGANYSGLCPFHNEKSPSFTVSPIKQFYHCFGCGAHGNAIGFLMAHLGLPFPDAIHELSSRAGMTMPENTKTTSQAPAYSQNHQQSQFKQKQFKTNQNTLSDENRATDNQKTVNQKTKEGKFNYKQSDDNETNSKKTSLSTINQTSLNSDERSIPVVSSNAKPNLTELSQLTKQAANYYRQQLRFSNAAIDYLKSRGLTGKIAALYQLGYAPASRQNLSAVFTHYDDQRLIEAGLVVQTNQSYERKTKVLQNPDYANEPYLNHENAHTHLRYDRFRDRIMFPIINNRGKVIAFGGRALGNIQPKYLNSAETPLFTKSNELYGLFEARQSIREKGLVIVVEGYIDVIKLAQFGFQNTVATLGTACTTVHIQKLVRQTERIIFCFDGDKAGRHAAERAMTAALPLATDNREFRFLFLPEEHDPDSFVEAYGADKFSEAMANATPLSAFLISKILNNKNLAEPEGRARAIFMAKPLLQAMPNQALRMQLINTLASRLNVVSDEITSLCDLNTHSQPRRRKRVPIAQRSNVLGNEQRALKNLLMFPRLVLSLKDEDKETLALCAQHFVLFDEVIQCVHQIKEKGPVSFETLSACLRQSVHANTFEEMFSEILEFAENVRDLLLFKTNDPQKLKHYDNLEKLAKKELDSSFLRLRYDACCKRLAELTKYNLLNANQLQEFSNLSQLSIALKKELNVIF